MTLFSSCTCVHLLCVLLSSPCHHCIKLYVSLISVCMYMYMYMYMSLYGNQTIH